MKNKIKLQNSKFNLLEHMSDILNNFCEENELDHFSASEIDYKTDQQRQWLERFIEVYYLVEERNCRRLPTEHTDIQAEYQEELAEEIRWASN
jgi:ribosomal protein S18